MNIYGPEYFDDAGLIAEIRAYVAARRELNITQGVVVIRGEGRWVEFTQVNKANLNTELEEMLYEARRRGLPIGGDPNSAIRVEMG